MARKGTVTIGFSGTYTDTDAQLELTALVGKQAFNIMHYAAAGTGLIKSTAAVVVIAGTALTNA